ncbi:hypothetical protein BDQ12DRAFT_352984 [Crucibulum laeve]|uniref:Uncharacterized protein n=1 Tax=Crucibulum laeve TaxID=68775 RepID=A0A5C3M9K5_9AGAR|nr:hypothetical protein BDQ12DRAFT_352984 [Crucibulum laeve]
MFSKLFLVTLVAATCASAAVISAAKPVDKTWESISDVRASDKNNRNASPNEDLRIINMKIANAADLDQKNERDAHSFKSRNHHLNEQSANAYQSLHTKFQPIRETHDPKYDQDTQDSTNIGSGEGLMKRSGDHVNDGSGVTSMRVAGGEGVDNGSGVGSMGVAGWGSVDSGSGVGSMRIDGGEGVDNGSGVGSMRRSSDGIDNGAMKISGDLDSIKASSISRVLLCDVDHDSQRDDCAFFSFTNNACTKIPTGFENAVYNVIQQDQEFKAACSLFRDYNCQAQQLSADDTLKETGSLKNAVSSFYCAA